MKPATCRRCGNRFVPKPTGIKSVPWSRCCETCGVRNLFDGLGMKTPPELLDYYTKNPALTEREFKEWLKTPEKGEYDHKNR